MIGSQLIADSHEPRDGSAWFWFSAGSGAVVAFDFSVGDDFDVNSVAERDEFAFGAGGAASCGDGRGVGEEVFQSAAVKRTDGAGEKFVFFGGEEKPMGFWQRKLDDFAWRWRGHVSAFFDRYFAQALAPLRAVSGRESRCVRRAAR